MTPRQDRRRRWREYELLGGHDPYPRPALTYTRHIDVLRDQCRDPRTSRTVVTHG